MNGTKFYLFHINGYSKDIGLQNLLLNNNYHIDYVYGNEIFVSEDEVYEVSTILKDEGLNFHIEGGE